MCRQPIIFAASTKALYHTKYQSPRVSTWGLLFWPFGPKKKMNIEFEQGE
jgi:hypothetical protein